MELKMEQFFVLDSTAGTTKKLTGSYHHAHTQKSSLNKAKKTVLKLFELMQEQVSHLPNAKLK